MSHWPGVTPRRGSPFWGFKKAERAFGCGSRVSEALGAFVASLNGCRGWWAKPPD